jgi:hypothetical protein
MPESTKVDLLVAEADSILIRYGKSYAGLSWREKVLLLVELLQRVKKLGINSNSAASRVSARERIRLYLLEHVGVPIGARELEVVSGISEYGRRARELRVQDGFKIFTGYSSDPDSGIHLTPSEYLLLETEPDRTAARRWHIANRIRQQGEGGSKGRLLRYLSANFGEIVTTEELYYVAKTKEFGRRTRELRTEEGFAIATMFTGRPDLKMGEYVLENAERIAEPHDRKIPFDVQKAVYKRDRNICRLCGWQHDDWRREDPRILELHHIREHLERGKNIVGNLIVLCSRCHDEIHAGRESLPSDILG